MAAAHFPARASTRPPEISRAPDPFSSPPPMPAACSPPYARIRPEETEIAPESLFRPLEPIPAPYCPPCATRDPSPEIESEASGATSTAAAYFPSARTMLSSVSTSEQSPASTRNTGAFASRVRRKRPSNSTVALRVARISKDPS